MTNSREPSRINSYRRRALKIWMLSPDAGFGGDGVTVACSESDCGNVLTYDTLYKDRIVPAEKGGRYVKGNVKPHCSTCSHRQGNRRCREITAELRRTCRYCKRTGQKHFVKMVSGFRCSSPESCRKRRRAKRA